MRRLRRDGYPASHQRRRDQGRSGGIHLPGGGVQTISGLACGKPIVAFLGGPLHFLPELNGCGAGDAQPVDFSELLQKLEQGVEVSFEMPRLEPLFRNGEEYPTFCLRHDRVVVRKAMLSGYTGNCYLGIDAGSATKLVLIGEDGELLYHFYRGNQSTPIMTAQFAIRELKREVPDTAKSVRACSTGYGEDLLKSAFSLDEGMVEVTVHNSQGGKLAHLPPKKWLFW